MRENELRKHAVCDLCKNKIGKSGLPMFWVVKISYHGIKGDVVQRQQGLTMMLGGYAELAGIMGPDEDMTMPLMDEIKLTVCQTCALEKSLPIAVISEYGEEGEDNG